MTIVCSIANQKGGVGKTTFSLQAIHYLLEIMKIEPARILGIDFDGQGNFSSRLAGTYINEYGDEVNDFKGGTASYQLYTKDLDSITPIVCPSGIHLIHSEHNDSRLFNLGEAGSESIVYTPKENLDKIIDNYDYVIIDCPPSLGRNLTSALVMSTHVAMPVRLAAFSIEGAIGLVETVINVQSTKNPDLKNMGVIINGMDRSVSHRNSYDILKSSLGDFMFKNMIRYRPPLDAATAEGVPIWSLPYGHVASAEVKAVMAELFDKVSKS